MEDLLLSVKKDTVKSEITYATTREGRQGYRNKELLDIVLVELVRLDFKRDDVVCIKQLKSLQALVKKGFNLRLYETASEYKIKIMFWSYCQGANSIGDISVSKEEKIYKLFKDAEIFAEDLIDQFNSDNENSL